MIGTFGSIEAQGVYLEGKPHGWSLDYAPSLVQQGSYYFWCQNPHDPYDYVLRKIGAAVLQEASTPQESAR